MPKTHYIDRPPFSLKDAYMRLIDAAGGMAEVADFVRVSSSQLHRYTDPALDDCHMPGDIILVLEKLAGRPVVSMFNAQKLGWDMQPGEGGAPKSVSKLAAELGHEMAELSGVVLEATADQTITPDEARAIAAEAADVQQKAGALIVQASHLVETPETDHTRDHPKARRLKAVS